MAEKYEFDLTFQETILRFIINNSDGVKGLKYVDDSFFALLQHSIIMFGIQSIFKKHARIPSEPILLQEVQELFYHRDYSDLITEEDKTEVVSIIKDLYSKPAKDGDIILEEIAAFSSYVQLKDTIENMDLEDFQGYRQFASKVNQAIDVADITKDSNQGIYIIRDVVTRQLTRQKEDLVVPLPYKGMNRLTSAGGYPPGSIIVFLDRPKRLKTNMLVNVGRQYIGKKKPVLYIDMDNSADDIASRFDQSIGRSTLREIVTGERDQELKKVLRRYRRLGGEVYIRRLPAFSTANDIQIVIDEVYRETGIRFKILIADYIGQMGSLSGKTDDFGRISDAYLDVGNLLLRNNIELCFTAHHVLRSASKRSSNRYIGEDIAKCIDIIRHAQAIYGLNATETEFQNDIVRAEIVEQRSGPPRGRTYFRVTRDEQRIDELTLAEIETLIAQEVLHNPDQRDEVEEEPAPRQRSRGDA